MRWSEGSNEEEGRVVRTNSLFRIQSEKLP